MLNTNPLMILPRKYNEKTNKHLLLSSDLKSQSETTVFLSAVIFFGH